MISKSNRYYISLCPEGARLYFFQLKFRFLKDVPEGGHMENICAVMNSLDKVAVRLRRTAQDCARWRATQSVTLRHLRKQFEPPLKVKKGSHIRDVAPAVET